VYEHDTNSVILRGLMGASRQHIFAELSEGQQFGYVHCSQKTIVATFATLGSRPMYQTTRRHV
jgi:hypothetical protein